MAPTPAYRRLIDDIDVSSLTDSAVEPSGTVRVLAVFASVLDVTAGTTITSFAKGATSISVVSTAEIDSDNGGNRTRTAAWYQGENPTTDSERCRHLYSLGQQRS